MAPLSETDDYLTEYLLENKPPNFYPCSSCFQSVQVNILINLFYHADLDETHHCHYLQLFIALHSNT
jgi:hypothetical protein